MKPAWLGKVPPDFTVDGGKVAEIRAAHKENPEIDRTLSGRVEGQPRNGAYCD